MFENGFQRLINNQTPETESPKLRGELSSIYGSVNHWSCHHSALRLLTEPTSEAITALVPIVIMADTCRQCRKWRPKGLSAAADLREGCQLKNFISDHWRGTELITYYIRHRQASCHYRKLAAAGQPMSLKRLCNGGETRVLYPHSVSSRDARINRQA